MTGTLRRAGLVYCYHWFSADRPISGLSAE